MRAHFIATLATVAFVGELLLITPLEINHTVTAASCFAWMGLLVVDSILCDLRRKSDCPHCTGRQN